MSKVVLITGASKGGGKHPRLLEGEPICLHYVEGGA